MRIILIGMPGCGKSCMARALSSKLKLKSIDADKVIEKRLDKKLQDIIDEVGLDEFGKIEEEALLSINDDNAIIATGGSAVYYEAAMENFRKIGTVIYLKCSFNTIKNRLGDFSRRGVVLKPGQSLYDLYCERTPLYEKYADFTLNCDGNAYTRYQNELIEYIGKIK